MASASRKECLHQRLAAAMQSGRLTRRTLAGEPLTDFPIKQFWVQNDTGELWWDLDYYLYALFRDTSVTTRKRSKWLSCDVKAVFVSTPATSASCHVHLRRATQPANLLNANTCTTVGVLVILAQCIDVARSAPGVNVPTSVFRHIVPTSCSVLQPLVPRVCNCLYGEFSIDCDGRMYGWQRLCTAVCGHNKTMVEMVEHIWGSLHAQGIVWYPFQCESHSLTDVVLFICLICKQGKSEGRSPGGRLTTFRTACFLIVVSQCLGVLFSELVQSRRCNGGNADVLRPPPSIRTTCKRNYVAVGAEAAWNLLEKAAQAGTSLEAALVLKGDEVAYGCVVTQGVKWINIALQLSGTVIATTYNPKDQSGSDAATASGSQSKDLVRTRPGRPSNNHPITIQ